LFSVKIKPFNVSISNNVSLTNQITLDDFAYTGNQHIESGYFAPGGSATLDITIDASETDVALEYVIDFDTTPLATHPNIVLSITNLDTNQAMTGNHYTGTMMLNDNREISLRLTLAWNNVASYNSNDSVLIDDPLSFTMSINFSQILSSSGSGNSI